MSIEKDPKYQLFFEALNDFCNKNRNNEFKIKNDKVLIIGLQTAVLSFDNKKQYDKIEIPNLKTNLSIDFAKLNCDELIFNQMIAKGISIINSDFNSLKFKCYDNTSVDTFCYFNPDNKNDNSNKITIPININFREIFINDNNNYTWEIEDNKYLKLIALKNVKIHKINKYDCIKTIEIENTNLNFNEFKFNEMKSLKKIGYSNINLSENIDISDMIKLKKLNLYIKDKSKINLENLPALNILNINSHERNNNNDNYLDLNKINSDNLSCLKIKGFKIKNPSILYSYKIEELDISDNSESVKGKLISILLKDKTFNFYSPEKYDFFDYINNYGNNYYFYFFESKINPHANHGYDYYFHDKTNDFFTLMKSTDLMKKLIFNKLDSITKKDLLTIEQKDIKGFKAISYCQTVDALKVILNSKNYTLNETDVSSLNNEILKSYYQKELIKSNLSTELVKKENNRIQKNVYNHLLYDIIRLSYFYKMKKYEYKYRA